MKLTYLLSRVFFAYGLLAALSMSIVGCSKEKKNDPTPVDTQKPVLTALSPTLDFKIAAGMSIPLKVQAVDDRGLSQIKVEMHHAFDDHTHKTTKVDTFYFKHIKNISGLSYTYDSTIKIPSNTAPGSYHLIVECLDKAGNKADFVEFDIEVTNTSQPQFVSISIQGKAITGNEATINLNGAESLKVPFKVQAIDDKLLYELHIEAFLEGSKEPFVEMEVENEKQTKEFSFDFEIGVDKSMAGKKLDIHLHIKDKEGYENKKKLEVTVKP